MIDNFFKLPPVNDSIVSEVDIAVNKIVQPYREFVLMSLQHCAKIKRLGPRLYRVTMNDFILEINDSCPLLGSVMTAYYTFKGVRED